MTKPKPPEKKAEDTTYPKVIVNGVVVKPDSEVRVRPRRGQKIVIELEL